MRRRQQPPVGPFERHLRDAIALNRERAPIYAARSNGASLRISRALIAAEWMILPIARWFDRRAEPYERAGVPLLESVFVSMSTVPPLRDLPAIVNGPDRPSVRPRDIRRRVARTFALGSFRAASDALSMELAALHETPNTNCLVRHLLESAHRLSRLAPHHESAARARGLPSPSPLLARLLRLHLQALGPAGMLDRWARPLQACGIGILALDLPPIAAEPID